MSFLPTQQEIQNLLDATDNPVVIVDSSNENRRASVTENGELRVIVTGGGSAGQLVTDGQESVLEDVGRIVVGYDGTDYQFISVNSSGHLNVIGPLTDTQLRATPIPVSGTFWQATQPVSGPLTDTELRATPVPVSATDLDIRDLTHASDSIKVGDGSEFLLVNADGSVNVKSSSGRAIDCGEGRLFSSTMSVVVSQTEVASAYFGNPSGSGIDIILHQIIVDVITKSNQAIARFYVNPTVTANGTTNTIGNRRLKGSPLLTSLVFSYRNPTVSSNGTIVSTLSAGENANALIVNIDEAIILGEEYSILMTLQATGNNTEVSITLVWAEK